MQFLKAQQATCHTLFRPLRDFHDAVEVLPGGGGVAVVVVVAASHGERGDPAARGDGQAAVDGRGSEAALEAGVGARVRHGRQGLKRLQGLRGAHGHHDLGKKGRGKWRSVKVGQMQHNMKQFQWIQIFISKIYIWRPFAALEATQVLFDGF